MLRRCFTFPVNTIRSLILAGRDRLTLEHGTCRHIHCSTNHQEKAQDNLPVDIKEWKYEGPKIHVQVANDDDLRIFQEAWENSWMPISMENIMSTRDYLAPDGFLVARTPEKEVAGFVFGVILNEELGMAAGVIVSEKFQKMGLGRRLFMEETRSVLGNRNMVQDAFYDLKSTYATWGYKDWSYTMRDYGGHLRTDQLAHNNNCDITPLSEVVFGNLMRFDNTVHVPCRTRTNYLQYLLKRSDTIAMAAINGGQIQGYAMAHDIAIGNTILGPVYADDSDVAKALISSILPKIPAGNSVYMAAHEETSMGMDIAEELGLQEQGRAIRMATQKCPEMNLGRIKLSSFPSAMGCLLC